MGANFANMAKKLSPENVATILYVVSIFETMDQYFIMNLTCSSLIDGASFVVSAAGLLASSATLYFKGRMDIERAADLPSDKDLGDKASSAQMWKYVYMVAGCGSWCGGFYVGCYAVNIYPAGSLEHTMGVIDIIGCILVALVVYYFGARITRMRLKVQSSPGEV